MGFVDKPQKLWWRKLLFQVHLWTGIGLGLYIFVISVTGAALVFREEIETASTKPIVGNTLGARATPHNHAGAAAAGEYRRETT